MARARLFCGGEALAGLAAWLQSNFFYRGQKATLDTDGWAWPGAVNLQLGGVGKVGLAGPAAWLQNIFLQDSESDVRH